MAGLGLVVTWAGYLLMSYGYSLVKGTGLTLSDLALPSHRQHTLSVLQQAKELSAPTPQPTAGQLQTSGTGVPLQFVTSGPNAGEIVGAQKPNPVSGKGALQAIFGPPAGG